ncbi:MAG: hypothetical protein AABM41_05785 [Chloroflexota bacterium]
MSRGRPRHQGSRRRAYSVRQREVRERRVRLAHDGEWMIDGLSVTDAEPPAETEEPTWTIRLHGAASAA